MTIKTLLLICGKEKDHIWNDPVYIYIYREREREKEREREREREKYIYISAVKWLIAITRIQNKSLCLHNICVSTVYIYFVYIKTHRYNIYIENVYMYLHVYIYIHIIYII